MRRDNSCSKKHTGRAGVENDGAKQSGSGPEGSASIAMNRHGRHGNEQHESNFKDKSTIGHNMNIPSSSSKISPSLPNGSNTIHSSPAPLLLRSNSSSVRMPPNNLEQKSRTATLQRRSSSRVSRTSSGGRKETGNSANNVKRSTGTLPIANVGSTVAALAAVLAAAPTAIQTPDERAQKRRQSQMQHEQQLPKLHLQQNQNHRGGGDFLAVPSPSSATRAASPRSACSTPTGHHYRPPDFSPSPSPYSALPPRPGTAMSSGAQPHQQQPSTPLRSLRHEFSSFKRRSISEISLVLELIRGATRSATRGLWDNDYDNEDEEVLELDSDPEGNYHSPYRHHRFHTISPHVPTDEADGDLFGCNGSPTGRRHRMLTQSTGNLAKRGLGGGRRRLTLRRKFQWERLSPAAIQRQIVHVQEEKAMLQAPTAPIDASKFVAYVQERRKKRILFKGEFLMIQRSVDPQKATTEIAIRMGDKNQYPDTLPYDHNRVVLELRPGIEDSHYINASYVNSWLHERAYVVTQSVRSKHASNELWRCVWELGSNTIVMLTKIFDFMRVVCLQYWPQTHFQFGEIHVELLETQTYAHFVIRTFRLRKTGGVGGLLVGADTNSTTLPPEERIVSHFHFTEWELNSFPYTSAFIELRRRVRQWTDKNPVNAPIIVHCSNGGGRSGAFLAIDANLELLQRTGQLDVYEYGRILASARQHLISSVEQYMFIYDVLCEAVLCNIQPMAMHQLKDRSSMYKARKDRELMELQDSHENKLLTMLTAPLRIGDCAGGHRLENRGKNRDVMVVPPDHARPYLQTLHGESKDYTYINAVEVDGFARKSEFIVTEWPKQQTLDSFWTLIFDHNVHTVICLTNQPSDTKLYPPFIHNKGKKNYGPFTVEIVNFQQYPGLCSHMVKISKRPTCAPVPLSPANMLEKPGANKRLTFMISEIMATGANQQQLEAEVRLCCIIQVRMWPIENKVPLSTTALIEVLKMTRSWRKKAPDRPESRPTIVMSHNGISRCGIFIAANVCIDQMELDHEVDVFHAVKLIRLNRPQLIDMKDEYKYLYDFLLHWYMTNPELRSHEPPEIATSSMDSESEDELLLPDGGLNRSRSGSRRRSIQRSKSSRTSRRTQKTGTNSTLDPNSAIAGGGGKVTRTSSSVSGTRTKREPIYLN